MEVAYQSPDTFENAWALAIRFDTAMFLDPIESILINLKIVLLRNLKNLTSTVVPFLWKLIMSVLLPLTIIIMVIDKKVNLMEAAINAVYKVTLLRIVE